MTKATGKQAEEQKQIPDGNDKQENRQRQDRNRGSLHSAPLRLGPRRWVAGRKNKSRSGYRRSGCGGYCQPAQSRGHHPAGRVQLNGKVVCELGTKHDATRDHIRVDGKLLRRPRGAALLPAEQAARLCDDGRRPAEAGRP